LFEVNKIKSRNGTNNETGSGYGLSIAKHFIENFGGMVKVSSIEKNDSNLEHGTIFTVTLPNSPNSHST
jgi:signal transduction histidine kinase